MKGFVDDLAGAIYDVLQMLLKGFSYFLAGGLIVSAAMYLFVFAIGLITD